MHTQRQTQTVVEGEGDVRTDTQTQRDKHQRQEGSAGGCGNVGGYEIHVTREGNRGWPNEVRGLSEDVTNR